MITGENRAHVRAASIAVSLATFVLMLGTESRLAPVWDEGFTLLRLPRMQAWLRAMRDPAKAALRWKPHGLGPPLQDVIPPPLPAELNTRAKLITPPVVTWFWPYAREEPHGHPPFYGFVALIGDLVAPSLDQLGRARLGSMLFFSVTVGCLFCFLALRRGTWAAAAGAGAFALHPHLFALGHYAHYDALLTCLWTDSVLAFALAVEPSPDLRTTSATAHRPRWSSVMAFGFLAGAAAGTKLTGWFLPLPFLAWTILYRDRRGLITLLLGGVIAAVALYAMIPPWWTAPLSGVTAFFRSNLTRAATHPVPVMFLGEIYTTPIDSLPWYNTLFLTAITTPVGFLALALVGICSTTRWRGDRLGMLFLFNLAFPLFLRTLPHTPGHDGIRQFLPALGALALIAGLGASRLVACYGNRARAVVAMALLEGAISIGLTMPVPLSYFSPIIGGLPGATRFGMEPTYYWDALSDHAVGWINRHTSAGRSILFSAVLHPYFYLKSTERLKPDALFFPPVSGVTRYVVRNRPWSWYELDRRLVARFGSGRVIAASGDVPLAWEFSGDDLSIVMRDWQWYIVQNRPGFFSEVDRRLIARFGPVRVIASKWSVPLIWAFSQDDVAEAVRTLRDKS